MIRLSLPRTKTLTYILVVAVTNFVCLYSGWILRETSQQLIEKVSSPRRRLSQHSDSSERYALQNSDSVERYVLQEVSSATMHSSGRVPSTQHSARVSSASDTRRFPSDRNLVIKKAKMLRLFQSFRPIMTKKEINLLSSVLHRFVSEMYNTDITYFMYGGTLLGSYRHHDVIPWDDDVDFIVPVRQRQLMYKLLNGLKPRYFLDVKQKTRWKFYSIASRPIRGYTWSWPFLDISFYQENSTHMWDIDSKFSESFVYDKTKIFPLTMRPFMDMTVPAPRDTESVLLQNYNPDVCESNIYSHRSENSIPSMFRKSVPCSVLMDKFPFVHRRIVRQGVNETLEVKGQVLRWFVDEMDDQ